MFYLNYHLIHIYIRLIQLPEPSFSTTSLDVTVVSIVWPFIFLLSPFLIMLALKEFNDFSDYKSLRAIFAIPLGISIIIVLNSIMVIFFLMKRYLQQQSTARQSELAETKNGNQIDVRPLSEESLNELESVVSSAEKQMLNQKFKLFDKEANIAHYHLPEVVENSPNLEFFNSQFNYWVIVGCFAYLLAYCARLFYSVSVILESDYNDEMWHILDPLTHVILNVCNFTC